MIHPCHNSCQAHHLGVVCSGKLKVQHSGSSDELIFSGDVHECRPGQQADVVGKVLCVMLEFNSEAVAK